MTNLGLTSAAQKASQPVVGVRGQPVAGIRDQPVVEIRGQPGSEVCGWIRGQSVAGLNL